MGHFREFTLTELKNMFNWESFEVLKAVTFDPPYKNIELKILKYIQYIGPKFKKNIFILAQK